MTVKKSPPCLITQLLISALNPESEKGTFELKDDYNTQRLVQSYSLSISEAIDVDRYLSLGKSLNTNKPYEINQYISDTNTWRKYKKLAVIVEFDNKHRSDGLYAHIYRVIALELGYGDSGIAQVTSVTPMIFEED